MDGVMERKNGITEGVIWKQILYFFFPMLFGTFFQQLYNTADAIIVGKFVGKEALSAVGGPTGSLINVFVGFFTGIATGATVTLAQYYGGKKDEEVSKTVHTAYAVAIAGGFFIMVIGLIGAPYALKWMGTPEDVMPYSLTYIRIYFLGMIANLIYNMGAGILRAIGDSKRPLYFLIASCFINIVLDLLFVVVFKWSVAGAAIATIISQICSAIFVSMVLIKSKDTYKLNLLQIKFHKEILKKILYIGLPAGFQSLMYSTSNLFIQTNVNSFGTNTVAAWSAYSKIDGVFWMTMGSFGVAVTTFVGQNFGAGNKDRVYKGIRICLAMAMGTALAMSSVLYLVGSNIYLLFTDDITVISIGTTMLRFMVPFYITYVSVEIFSGSLRAMGNVILPMFISLFGICVIRIIWLSLAVPIFKDIKTVMFSYPLTWMITSLMFITYYLYNKKKLVIRESLNTVR